MKRLKANYLVWQKRGPATKESIQDQNKGEI